MEFKDGTLVTDSDKPYHQSKNKRYYLLDRIAEFSQLMKLNYDVHHFARLTDDELIEDIVTKAMNIADEDHGGNSFQLSNYSTTKKKRAHLVEVLEDLLTDEWDAEDHVSKTEDELISSIIDAMWYYL